MMSFIIENSMNSLTIKGSVPQIVWYSHFPLRNVGRENDAFWVEIKCWNCQVTCDVTALGFPSTNQRLTFKQRAGQRRKFSTYKATIH